MKRNILFIMVLVLFIPLGCSSSDSDKLNDSGDFYDLTINDHLFQVEIADSPEERQMGLMHRESMDPDEGMIFVFSEDQKLAFWMKNTLIPLSIAYIDSRGIIREIHHMTPLSERPVPSSRSVRFALELNQGRFAELAIEPGMSIIMKNGLPTTRE